jgi:hypothetical protein
VARCDDPLKPLILKLHHCPIAKFPFTMLAGVGKMIANQVLESECQLRFGLFSSSLS